MGRRRFLGGALALATAGVATRTSFADEPPARPAGPLGAPAWPGGSPFTLGVASGYPHPTGVVLWTRLAPAPLIPGGGMPRETVPVDWEVATDDRMANVVQHGTAVASPDWAHAVHVEVEGLEPGRWYWYRFRARGAVSAVGRTRTAPAAGAVPDRLRFAFASCQHWEQGYFGAYPHLVADDPDLVVFLGDYIYESARSRETVRKFGAPEPHTLEDYRARHALYKTDRDLQAAHAACPWVVTWDDHEVANDYADDRSQDLQPRERFLARRAAAYRAYCEHMPLRREMMPTGPHMRLFSRVAFGNLAQFHLLDDRQYRTYQPCTPPGRGGSTTVEDCAERLDQRQTMLGLAQERWLESGLDGSQARWNVVGQQTLMAQLDRKPGEGQQFWTDGWDGYPLARRRFLDYLGAGKPSNPVVIGGDVHSFWVTDLRPDFDDVGSPVVATELAGTSITSRFPVGQTLLEIVLGDNPHVRFANGTRRGYVRVDVTSRRLRADFRALRSVTQPRSEIDTLASFVVEDGRPGAVRA
ncbi:MAG: alkaline phosphatase D family protein [Candidatus Rokuibacteriota bacterium]